MMGDSIEDIRAFLFENIVTYEQLAALVLLHEAPDVEWSTKEVATRLNVEDADGARCLLHLVQHNLARQVGAHGTAFKYDPGNEERTSLVAKVLSAYAEDIAAIVNIMTENAIARVRSSALHQFAEGSGPGKKADE